MNDKTPSPPKLAEPDTQIDLQEWLSKLIKYWWLLLAGLTLSVAAGQLYLRYSTFEYAANAKVLIKGVGRSGSLSESGILADNLGISAGGKDMNNEIEILRSRPILVKTIKKINAHITYYRLGSIKNTELYNTSPILVNSFELNEDVKLPFTFFVTMGYYNDFEFSKKQEGKPEVYEYGQEFENHFGKFLIERNEDEKLVPGVYQINLLDPEGVAGYYKNQLIVEIVGAQGSSSILELKLIDQSPEKAKDLLDTLISVYNEEEINDETQVLTNTVHFISERMKRLSAELNDVEGEIAQFKSQNEIVTENALSSKAFAIGELRTAYESLSELEVEMELLHALQDRLMDPKQENQLIPPDMTNANPALSALINEYNSLFLQQKKLLNTASEESPLIVLNQGRLEDIEGLILASLNNLKEDLQFPIASAQLKIDQLKRSMTAVPDVEKQLLEKQRKQTIKENLYLFLLQRKEETELSKAVTTGSVRIIEDGKSSRGPVYPQKKLIMLASILLGLIIPILIIAGLALLETTVNSEEMVNKITSIPVIGRIMHKKTKDNIIFKKGERSTNVEMFRSIRTNLNYLGNKGKQVILITSSTSGEGKSMITLNLGATVAMSGKKTIVVGLDLRRPTLSKYLDQKVTTGVTEYLTGNCELEDIIHSYEGHEDFYYIASGMIPPDPAELIMSDKMTELIEHLKRDFDFIILDSPPIVVTDPMLLRGHITNTLLVVRCKYTRKEMVRHLNELYVKGEFVKPTIILNDIPLANNRYGLGRYNPYDGAGYYVNEA